MINKICSMSKPLVTINIIIKRGKLNYKELSKNVPAYIWLYFMRFYNITVFSIVVVVVSVEIFSSWRYCESQKITIIFLHFLNRIIMFCFCLSWTSLVFVGIFQAADRRYLSCPGNFTVGHLKKFIKMKFNLSGRFQVCLAVVVHVLISFYSVIVCSSCYSFRYASVIIEYAKLHKIT